MDEIDLMNGNSNIRQCRATSKQTGHRCRRAAIPGGFVCRIHGGGAKQVKKAARERLQDLVDPAISSLKKVLERAIETEDYGAVVRAANSILDRTGYHPSRAIEMSGPDGGATQNEDLLPVESLSLACRQLVLAELDGFTMSPELERKLLDEIPPLKVL